MSSITQVEPFLLQVPVGKPASTDGKVKYLCGVWVRTGDGREGTGNSGMRPSPFDLFPDAVLAEVRAVLLGEDPADVRGLWRRLADSKLRQLGPGAATTGARAAVDIALWDLLALTREAPLHAILGAGRAGQGISTYITVGDPSWEDERLIKAAVDLAAAGWSAVKVKVGRPDPIEDARRIANIRRELGDGVQLMADANQRWTLPQARAFAQRAENCDLKWLEEPCHAEDVGAHAALARCTTVPLALGENVTSRFGFRDLLVAEAVHYVQADATRLAGVTEWLAVAGTAESFGATVVPHHSDFGQVHQHCAAAVGLGPPPMLEFPWQTTAFAVPVRREGMAILVDNSSGASTTLATHAAGVVRLR